MSTVETLEEVKSEVTSKEGTGETPTPEVITQDDQTQDSTKKEPEVKVEEKKFSQEQVNEMMTKRFAKYEATMAELKAAHDATIKQKAELETQAKQKAFNEVVESHKLFAKFKDEIKFNEDGTTNIKQLAEEFGLPMKTVKIKPTHNQSVRVEDDKSIDLSKLNVMHGVRV